MTDQPETDVWERLDATMELDVAETIRPPPDRGTWSAFSLGSLPRIRMSDEGDEEPELELSRTLGEGGMGVVLAAEQLALGRQVAVKTLRGGGAGADERRSLLQEAWIIGSLEHPNIVPIYTLGRSADDEPLIVMKRIEGRTWEETLEAGDRSLQWHLELLIDVCRALEYAHDRGIVHRDIKPANVMTGNFGEVYLLDWGVALSLVDDGSGRFPLAAESSDIVGTPQYMAPEMTTAQGEIDVRTDVYLLGAVLHEVLTGRPRHTGDAAIAVLMHAFRSEPFEYGPGVPDGLAEICRRATGRDPADRHQSVAEFRDAIEQYLEHRSSIELADEARQRLDALRRETRGSPDDLDRQAKVREFFGQCQFGFEHALRVWPENMEAIEGRREALVVMIRWELASDNPAGANALLSQLESPPPELARQCEQLRRETARRDDELREHRRERDLRIGARSRVYLGAGVAIVFSALPLFVSYLIKTGVMHHPDGLRSVGLSFILFVFLGAFRIFAPGLSENLVNRRIVSVLLLAALALPVIRIIGVLRDIDVTHVLGFEFALFGVAAGVVAMLTNRMMYSAMIFYFAGGLLAAAFPHYTLEVFGVTNGLAGTVMVLWLRAPSQRVAGAA